MKIQVTSNKWKRFSKKPQWLLRRSLTKEHTLDLTVAHIVILYTDGKNLLRLKGRE